MPHVHRAIFAGVILWLSTACSSEQGPQRTEAGLPIVHLEAVPRKHEIELTLRTEHHELIVFHRGEARRFMVSGQTRSLDAERFARFFPELHAVYRAATSEQGMILRDETRASALGCGPLHEAV